MRCGASRSGLNLFVAYSKGIHFFACCVRPLAVIPYGCGNGIESAMVAATESALQSELITTARRPQSSGTITVEQPLAVVTPRPSVTPSASPVNLVSPTTTPVPTMTAESGQELPLAPSHEGEPTLREGGRYLDPRLPALGVTISEADVVPGQPYWRVAEVVWQDEQQANGGISIYVDVLDEDGGRLVGQPVIFSWPEGSNTVLVEDKPFPEYGANFPMFAHGNAYSVIIDGLPSEGVHGMGLGTIEQRDWSIHVQYLIRYQKSIK